MCGCGPHWMLVYYGVSDMEHVVGYVFAYDVPSSNRECMLHDLPGLPLIHNLYQRQYPTWSVYESYAEELLDEFISSVIE